MHVRDVTHILYARPWRIPFHKRAMGEAHKALKETHRQKRARANSDESKNSEKRDWFNMSRLFIVVQFDSIFGYYAVRARKSGQL